jgi:hypothetical protein
MDSLLKSWAATAVEAGASSRSPITDLLARELKRPVFIEVSYKLLNSYYYVSY